MSMISVSGVEFYAGSTHMKNEMPVRKVYLSPFSIDTYPVTNRKYSEFVSAKGYERKEFWTEQGWNFITKSRIDRPLYWDDPCWNAPDMPVTGVCWWEALAYAAYADKSLPTEAQWEYAAGGGVRTYPWGEEEPTFDHANFADECEPTELDRRAFTVTEASKNISFVGCRDMAGNVAEWCIDNGSANYAWDYYRINPVFLIKEEDTHIAKGGSGLHNQDYLRCASRDDYLPSIRDNIVGFRCVRNLTVLKPD